MWTLLRALPTKADIESLMSRLETQHRKDIQEVRGELSSLDTRLTAGETSVMDLEWRVSALEHLQDAHIDTTTMLQLHMEEMEDRSRRNNLRLWGLPEAMGPEDLPATATELSRPQQTEGGHMPPPPLLPQGIDHPQSLGGRRHRF